MLLDSVSSIALYCQHCGKIEVRSIPYFCGSPHGYTMRCSSCSHELAKVKYRPGGRMELSLGCSICHNKSSLQLNLKPLRRLGFERLYCQHDNFELGYIGQAKRIKEFLEFNRAEYAAANPDECLAVIDQQQRLLEGINRIHDIAHIGEITCQCGSHSIGAAVMGSSIYLECFDCGSFCKIDVDSEKDLLRIRPGMDFDFQQPSMLNNQ